MGKWHREPEDLSSAELLRLVRRNRAKSRTVEKHARWSLDDFRELGAVLRESSVRLDGLIEEKREQNRREKQASSALPVPSGNDWPEFRHPADLAREYRAKSPRPVAASNATLSGAEAPTATALSNSFKPAKTPQSPKYRIKPKESR